MQYKTILLDLLQQQPELHEQLRSTRTLLTTLESLASELKERHEAWQKRLSQTKPGSDPTQIASEALEIALQEMKTHFSCEPQQDEHEPLSLDNAMTFVRNHTSDD